MKRGGPKPDAFDDSLATKTMGGDVTPTVAAILRIEDPEAGAADFVLSGGTCRVGSSPKCDLVVRHRNVSRTHAELTLTADGILVRDLESRNGTFYLGQRIGALTVSIGARIQLGSVTLAIDPDSESLLVDLHYDDDAYVGLLGASDRMRRLFALLQRLERSRATVLIEGESGVGKEVVAQAIHARSRVGATRMVALNCGAVPRELVASELFGHRRGAFSGAVESRKGAFQSAHGGTLFLDEVGELPPDVQPALLRALELGEIKSVGDDQPQSVDVRIIAATNRDLQAEVAAGRFRQDLYFRLAVVRIQVPPLRSRPEDVAVLAAHFARQEGLDHLPKPILEELRARSFPGNARELKNAVQSYAALGHLPPATTATRAPSLGDALAASIDPTLSYAEQKEALVEQFTRAYLDTILAYTRGNQAAAARIAKLDRTYVSRLLAKYGIRTRRHE